MSHRAEEDYFLQVFRIDLHIIDFKWQKYRVAILDFLLYKYILKSRQIILNITACLFVCKKANTK